MMISWRPFFCWLVTTNQLVYTYRPIGLYFLIDLLSNTVNRCRENKNNTVLDYIYNNNPTLSLNVKEPKVVVMHAVRTHASICQLTTSFASTCKSYTAIHRVGTYII